MNLRLVRVAPFVCVLTTANAVRGDTPPNVWDLAKNPNAYDQYARHVQIERDMNLSDVLTGVDSITMQAAKLKAEDDARMIIESTIGPKNVWLRYDEAWVLMKRKQFAAAAAIFEEVAHELDSTPFVEEVWEHLAECYVNVEDTDGEIHAYDQVLTRTSSDLERATPLLNQGEALLRKGDTDAAIDQFREVLAIGEAQTSLGPVYTLAQWDLAVALDRSGDPRTALDAARKAVSMDGTYVTIVGNMVVTDSALNPDPMAFYVVPPGLYPISRENKSVYFVPEYERDWYLALGYEVLAADPKQQKRSLANWRNAETHMMEFVTQATMHASQTHKPDIWLDLAKTRLDTIRRRRAEAQKQAGPVTRDASGALPL